MQPQLLHISRTSFINVIPPFHAPGPQDGIKKSHTCIEVFACLIDNEVFEHIPHSTNDKMK